MQERKCLWTNRTDLFCVYKIRHESTEQSSLGIRRASGPGPAAQANTLKNVRVKHKFKYFTKNTNLNLCFQSTRLEYLIRSLRSLVESGIKSMTGET